MGQITPEAKEIVDGYFQVHEYGFVALKDAMGGDDAIEQAARVSYQAGTRKVSDTRSLIRYLKRHKHDSPFEMPVLRFHMSMPIFVARQFVRHRTASLNEVSGRYSVLPMQFYTPSTEDFQKQAKSNKQGRDGTLENDIYDRAVDGWMYHRDGTAGHYHWLLDNDVAREIARIDLPLSTYTQWYWQINLRNLFHFLQLRLDPHAQKESRDYAVIMAGMAKRVAPLAFEAFLDYDVYGESFSAQEMTVLWDRLAGRVPIEESRLGGKREAEEFNEKLSRKNNRQSFDLDLDSMLPGCYFESLVQESQ